MTITKKARAALLVMLFAISILPGCGKNKNADGVVGVNGLPGYIPGLPAGCTASYPLSYGFTGQNTSYTGISAQGMVPTGIQGLPNQPYYRVNNTCDRIDVATSGSTVVANVYLGPNATQIIQGYQGTVCGLDLSGSILSQPYNGSGWQGTFGGGVIRIRVCSMYGTFGITL